MPKTNLFLQKRLTLHLSLHSDNMLGLERVWTHPECTCTMHFRPSRVDYLSCVNFYPLICHVKLFFYLFTFSFPRQNYAEVKVWSSEIFLTWCWRNFFYLIRNVRCIICADKRFWTTTVFWKLLPDRVSLPPSYIADVSSVSQIAVIMMCQSLWIIRFCGEL